MWFSGTDDAQAVTEHSLSRTALRPELTVQRTARSAPVTYNLQDLLLSPDGKLASSPDVLIITTTTTTIIIMIIGLMASRCALSHLSSFNGRTLNVQIGLDTNLSLTPAPGALKAKSRPTTHTPDAAILNAFESKVDVGNRRNTCWGYGG